MSTSYKPRYSVAGLEDLLNAIIHFVFYYRLILVTVAMLMVGIAAARVWKNSSREERTKNISLVVGIGSLCTGIFYSILNYENNHLKYKEDCQKATDTLCYHSVNEWHQPNMVEHLKITKQLYDDYKHLIDDNRGREFFEILEGNEAGRSALVSILNYFEGIAIGIKRDILDDGYMKLSLGNVARSYVVHYGFYIQYRRAFHRCPDMWINFTNMVAIWNREVPA